MFFNVFFNKVFLIIKMHLLFFILKKGFKNIKHLNSTSEFKTILKKLCISSLNVDAVYVFNIRLHVRIYVFLKNICFSQSSFGLMPKVITQSYDVHVVDEVLSVGL